jgi:anti-sigma B factor antagonist
MPHEKCCLQWPKPERVYHQESKLTLTLEIREYEDITVGFCKGRIVYRDSMSALSQQLSTLFPHTQQLVLELSGVEAIDSAGLGELVLVLMWAEAAGCKVKLAAPRRRVRELLELTNLSSVFDIHSTLLDAMLAFHGQAA